MSLLNATILFIHLFCAVLFVGGSFFMWLVVVPASRALGKDESERTQVIGKMAKEFGRISNVLLAVLILTGIYNASWYLTSFRDLFSFKTYGDIVLFVKVVMVIALTALIYLHGAYYGRKIVRLARDKKFEELTALRRKSRVISFANLALMIAILVLAVMLQMPP
jgi:putative copper resistance protein D